MIYRATAHMLEAALRLRAKAGGSDTLRQRLALEALGPADIWFHGASVGELTSARPVVEALAQTHRVLVTANSVTGRDMAAGWGMEARLAPFDLPGALSRFLAQVAPRLQVTVESEFWPLRSQALADLGIAQAVIGARLSQRSASRWAHLPGLIGQVLGRLAALSAQDADSEARLRSLGLPDAAVLPRLDLKLLTPAGIAPSEPSAARDRILLAASTHEGEEADVLDAWQQARQGVPGLQLILAIRHPQRGDEVAGLLRHRGIAFQRRSDGGSGGDVLLADTLGEMDRWYAAAGLCFVGGSLTDRGGHTPWEPAAHGCAILHGPHVGNFRDAYAVLDQAGAAVGVDAASLSDQVIRLAADPAQARRMGGAARQVLDDRAGDPAALIARLRELAGTPR
ncbi:glycosyltransferase N-terminal domain-containing protein [Paracoccus sp. WLY502]|uniref:3-deoxy-D-manno-octulosonic acid transferase n=1 Tax=Paracoccus yibinensis TaxID=3068891 RepID=UPI0027966C31|nr:glycosyltransferase N-terminal domain-containing protein [Paracoccus sp. WLY502]MDQ1900142.1 glycosyltransferase N-terminal domain-containing protein [Paracoccus sp. WLY502]